MAVQQLLIRELEDGREEIEAVEVTATLGATAADQTPSGTHAALLGTADLVQLGLALGSRGYRIGRVHTRDARFQLLDEEEEELVSSEVRAWLRDGRHDRLLDYVHQLNLRVVRIDLQAPDRGRVSLLRDGSVLAQKGVDLTPFIAAVAEAWHEVFGD